MKETNILIEREFKKLPPEIQSAIIQSGWRDKVTKIALDNQLDQDKTNNLMTEVLLLIYSIESDEKFFNNLITEVNLDEKIAEKIFKAIEKDILIPMADSLDVSKDVEKQTATETVQQPSANKETGLAENKADEKPEISLPDYSNYDAGKDPYREPIE